MRKVFLIIFLLSSIADGIYFVEVKNQLNSRSQKVILKKN